VINIGQLGVYLMINMKKYGWGNYVFSHFGYFERGCENVWDYIKEEKIWNTDDTD